MTGTSTNVIPFLRRNNRDFLQQAVDAGRPMPLQILLEDLWRLVAEADRLEATGEPEDLIVARVCRTMARRIAVECAPYCHPKLSSSTIGGTDTPIRVAHEHHVFQGLSCFSLIEKS
jgi:hypothetical protein